MVNGVFDLQLTINAGGTSNRVLESIAVSQLQTLFKVDNLDFFKGNNLEQAFDNIMICLPTGSYSNDNTSQTDWLAYAYVGGSISVYNGDRWCANEVTQVHEIGHNFGLE